MFGREDKSDRLFLHELQNDQLISLINLTLQVFLNMKPKTDHRTFWTGLHDFLAVDIYQPREDLEGLSLAAKLIKMPDEFTRMYNLQKSKD